MIEDGTIVYQCASQISIQVRTLAIPYFSSSCYFIKKTYLNDFVQQKN